jgi:pyrroline-5-carboxylate reductase
MAIKESLGVIGCGKMGRALVQGLVSRGEIRADRVAVFDPVPAAVTALVQGLPGATAAESNLALAKNSEVILLCVKPGEVISVLKEIHGTGPKLIISIAAGVTLPAMKHAADPLHRLIRVMPNTPALVGQGASAFSLAESATREDAQLAEQILGAVGLVQQVPEKLIDAVTGLSGSGPAYVYLIIEALAEGGVLMGLPFDQALSLAAQTVAGAAQMVLQTGEHPSVLRHQVTSPGGTTIAGLKALEDAGVRGACAEAVKAATTRARELGGV